MKKRTRNLYHINPKFRAYGKARLDIAQRASSEEEWDRLWKKSAHPFPFVWEGQWKQCIEYKVDDFAAEVGFFIDILGLPINALASDYAMFTSPAGDFYFSVVPAEEGEPSTPPEAIRIQFLVANIQETALELEQRGIPFELWPQACREGSSLFIGYFRTPHGICVDLWGVVEGDGVEKNDQQTDYTDEDAGENNEDSIGSVNDVDEEEDNPSTHQQEVAEQTLDPSESGTGEPDEPINFSLFDRGEINLPESAEEAFPPGEDEPQEEIVELEYEYIDEDV